MLPQGNQLLMSHLVCKLTVFFMITQLQSRDKILSTTSGESSKSQQSEESTTDSLHLTSADQLDAMHCADSAESFDTSFLDFDIGLSLHSVGAPNGVRVNSMKVTDTNEFPQVNGQWSGYSHASLSDFSVFLQTMSENDH